jgi:hypothetical protein
MLQIKNHTRLRLVVFVFPPIYESYRFQQGGKYKTTHKMRGFLSVVIAPGFEPGTVCLEGSLGANYPDS